MSSPCYLFLNVRKADVERFWAEMDKDPRPFWNTFSNNKDEDDHGNPIYEVYEANYAWYDPLMKAARKGLVFCGFHGCGGSYAGGDFCAVGEKYFEVETVCGDGSRPVVGINSDGTLAEKEIENAKEYFAARKKVAELMKETPCNGESAGPTVSG